MSRYKDILPYNYTRVPLSEYPGVPGSDYINANFIKGASGSNAYIASQVIIIIINELPSYMAIILIISFITGK